MINKLTKCNEIIDMGKFSFNNTYKNDLKKQLNEMEKEIPKCKNLMNNYKQNNELYKYDIIQKILKDIQNTLSRYKALMDDKIVVVPKFVSAFKI